MEDALVKCDVLVVGGGLGGCMAAIKASEHDVKVTLVEKPMQSVVAVLEQETTIFGVTFLKFTAKRD